VLANGNGPFAVTAAGGTVYWSETTGAIETSIIRSCKLNLLPDGGPGSSCASTSTIVPAQSGTIETILVHGKSLYFTNTGQSGNTSGGALRRCDLPCGGAIDSLAPGAPAAPFDLVADQNALVWTTRTGYVLSCAYPCSAADTFDMGQPQPRFVDIDGANVFWTNGDGTIRA
jgi:hypothetical protein